MAAPPPGDQALPPDQPSPGPGPAGQPRSAGQPGEDDLAWLELPEGSLLGEYPDELLTDADIPPADEDYDVPDPVADSGPPPELAGLSDQELADLCDSAPPQPPPAAWPLCYRDPGHPEVLAPRDGTGTGSGFADGGVLDTLPAGIALAGFIEDTWPGTDALDDDSLVGTLRAWRRLSSWAQARELATLTALAGRRPADGYPPTRAGELPANLSEFVSAEIAAALTLTSRAAEAQLGLALDFAARPATWAALAAGRLDLPRATLIVTMTSLLTEEHAAAVEAAVLPNAPDQTTAQLRRALHRAILAVDPDAARRRREQAERQARVESWGEPEGTATLAGRSLPPAQVLAASKRLTRIATHWKDQGAVGGMDLLRAHAYLALLNGFPVDAPPTALLPDVPTNSGQPTAHSQSTGDGQPTGDGQLTEGSCQPDAAPELPPLAGMINLTVPLTTLLGLGDSPGEATRLGPIDADVSRQLACAMAGHPTTRWAITITGPAGRALAHGVARGNPLQARRSGGRRDGRGDGGWTIRVTAEPITTGLCDHLHQEQRYRPSPALQALVRAQTRTCSAYGCGREASRCDLDHTVPYDDGGITCECNLAPLCRYHHRVKQAEGWKLEQICTGVMAWLTPAGRRYITIPSQHPT